MSEQGGYPPAGDDPYGGRPIPPYDPPPPPGTPDHGYYGQSPYQQSPYQPPYQPPSQPPPPAGPVYASQPPPPVYGPPAPYGPLAPYGQPGYYYYAPPAQQVDGLAIGSLVCGIGGVLLSCCTAGAVLFAVLAVAVSATAVTLGFVGRKRIVESGGTRSGGGMAVAGIVCGFSGAAIVVMFLMITLALTL